MSEHLHGQSDGGANVLIHTSARDADGDKKCLDFLTAPPPQQSNVLFVTYPQTPDEQMRTWLEYTGERPANLGIIDVGETTRAATAVHTPEPSPKPKQPIQTVENPSDLTGLGITISEQLADWEGNPYQTGIWFDSITALLQSTDDVQTAYRFLHTLIGRVKTVQGRACYTITPDAHDERTVAILTSLFDDVHEGRC